MPCTAVVRIARFAFALSVLLGVVRLSVHVYGRYRFQRHLSARHITWNNFPRNYSDTLRSKDWAGLEIDKYDYPHWFPPSNLTIPRAIHFIWFNDLYDSRPTTQIASSGSNAPELCQKHNPSYNITIWDAMHGRQLIAENYAWFLPTYDAYRFPIQRIDALKYFILWHHGGVYMDLDVACRRPLDPLLEFSAWFPEASPFGVNNDLMASTARHPVISVMLENLKKRSRWNLIFPYLTIFWSTGPQFTGDMLRKSFVHRHGVAKTNETTSTDWFIWPRAFYSEKYTFFGHRPGGTWHGRDVASVLWLVAHPFIFWAFFATIASAAVLATRVRKRRYIWVQKHWKESEA